MAKKMYTVIAPCLALVVALAFVEPPGVAGFESGRQEHRRSHGRRHGAARKKPRRHAASYVCPMHPDMRSRAPGTCPKCLMELVRLDAKSAKTQGPRDVNKELKQ